MCLVIKDYSPINIGIIGDYGMRYKEILESMTSTIHSECVSSSKTDTSINQADFTNESTVAEKKSKRKSKRTPKSILSPLIIEDDLNEIDLSGDELEDGEVSGFKNKSIDELIQNGKTEGKVSGYFLIVAKSDKYDVEHYGLYDGNEFKAVMDIHPGTKPYPSIALTWTEPSARGNGLMKSLFKYIVDRTGGLMSDTKQSTQAQGMWKSMIKNPPAGCVVKVWNPEENKSSIIGNPSYPWSENPWNQSNISLLLTNSTNESCGRIVKDVNTTVDVGMDEITKQAAKFGNKVSRDGYPPIIGESELSELKLSGHEPENGPVSGLSNEIMAVLDTDGKNIGTLSGYDLMFAKGYSGEVNYGLYDSNSMIAGLLLNLSTNEYPAISVTWTSPKFRGKGLMKSLFVYLVKQYGAILSDGSQSDQAQGMWKSMIKNPPSGTKVLVWNEATHETSDIGDYYNDWSMNPWDGNPDTSLMLTKS